VAYLCRGAAGGWSPPSDSQPCAPARPTAASSVLVHAGHSANTTQHTMWTSVMQRRTTTSSLKSVSQQCYLFTPLNSVTTTDRLKVNVPVYFDNLFPGTVAKTVRPLTWCNQQTNQPTPWSRGLSEKLTDTQLLKKFPAFYGARRFITAFTTACHLSLSWARSIQ
jgi:hypothetical protein